MKIYKDTYTILSYSRSEIFSTSDDDTEISPKWKTGGKKGICKHNEMSIYLCNLVDLIKMPQQLILNMCY